DGEAALRALRTIADRLEAYLEGDELAFETLGEYFEEAGLSGEDMQEALLALRSLSGEAEILGLEGATTPARDSQRVLSSEERATLSPEAWGFLLSLRRRGSLDPGQFEQVLDQLSGAGIRPVDVDMAREVAARVALRVDDEDGPSLSFMEHDRAH
ncbi:MAG: DUF494 family protein, partial [Candidatus Eisenbacteria bacterium]